MQSTLARHSLKLGLRVVKISEFSLAVSPNHPPVPDDAVLRTLTPGDIESATRDPHLSVHRPTFEFAFDHGHMPIGLYLGKQLVNYVIFARDSAPGPDGTMIRLDRDLAYIYNTQTHPSFRGQRLMEVRVHLQRVLWEELGWDFKPARFAGYVDLANYSSIAVMQRMENAIVGYAGYWSGRERFRSFRDQAVKHMGFRFDKATHEEVSRLLV